MITFTVFGKPVAKQRARYSARSGRLYTPRQTVDYEALVASVAREHFPEPLTCAVRLTIFAHFELPKSWSQRKQREYLSTPHTQRPDVDNLLKGICDGLNGIAFIDDKQVAEVVATKLWSPDSKVVVFVERAPHAMEAA